MKLGAHISVAGGLYQAFERGAAVGCETMLIFTKSNRQWKAKPLSSEDIALFKGAQKEIGIAPISVHASYLINLASPKADLWEKSYQGLKVEVERAEQLGIPLLTFHPGSYVSGDETSGLENISRALIRLLEETAGMNVTICLETMAGQGTNLGSLFEQLSVILKRVNGGSRLAVCMDTCHVFAAGYDIRTADGYAKTMAEFDQIVGLEHIQAFHFNDSKFGLGENKDRHEHIGDGAIGLDGFAHFINDPRWTNHPAHIETPKTETDEEGNVIDMDQVNLERLKGLRKG